ncbi:carbon-nitrogen hydrolase family protein [Mesorhizobium sp. VK4C]|uniref:carbon-nitrogen hydrolase family protein n=1 Tax=Mesorhizobium captivum TaxID=3072319 RepID=UPI002A239A4E|nr:carbon-nitrogen hydrolase family protein [Mesorhizobium sp. VK4C]MDX8502119.1 carbon-nitrogen hydrolase family protein [Mesorhizobium sp. VK4C]
MMRTPLFLVAGLWLLASPVKADEAALPVRVAVIQLDSSKAGDFAAMLSYAKGAKDRGAEIVVYPEESVFGWLNPNVFYEAEPIPGRSQAAFADIAKQAGIWVAAGLAERGRQIAADPPTFEVFDSGILIDPQGHTALHYRQHNVIKNAFSECPIKYGSKGCSYTPGPLSDVEVAKTPFGRVGMLVCADAYTFDPSTLDALKTLKPNLVIVPWGVTAGTPAECGKPGFNATGFAVDAATHLKSAYVVGANSVGERPYGRFRPSFYCGTSGYATPAGKVGGVADETQDMAIFDIPVH